MEAEIARLEQSNAHGDGLAGDLVVGADAIGAFLVHLGMPKDVDVYYLRRSSWPIGSTAPGKRGGVLVASKRKLIHFTQKLATSSVEGKHD